jgi:hypothetical protein
VCIPLLEFLDRNGATMRLDAQLRRVADGHSPGSGQ